MIWYDRMLLGKRCRRKANQLKYQISNRLRHEKVYLLVLARRENALLDIIPSVYLLQKQYPTDDLHIIGMAATESEALDMVKELIGKVYVSGQDFDIYTYMQQYR